MTEPMPHYTTATPGVKPARPELLTVELEQMHRTRVSLIDALRQVDRAIYGRDDYTVPRRRR